MQDQMLDSDQIDMGSTPAQMRFSDLMSSAVPGDTKSLRLQANNGAVFSPSGSQIIRIPMNVSHGFFIDTASSCLKMDIQVTRSVPANSTSVPTDIFLDGGIASVIDVFRIEAPNGSLLEEIRGYNLLNANLSKYIRAKDVSESYAHQFDGSSSNGSPLANDKVQFTQSVNSTGSAVTQTSTTKTFCLQLNLSGILSSHRYFPAGFTTGSPCTIVIQLANATDALVALPTTPAGAEATDATWSTQNAGTIDYNLTNIEYMAQIVSFNDETQQLFTSMLSQVGGVMVDFNTPYHVSTSSLNSDSTGSATQFIANLPVRTRSTNAVFHLIQNLPDRNNILAFGLSSLRARKATQYQHRLGGMLYPQQPITISNNNQAHAYYETVRCFKSPSDHHTANMLKKSTTNITTANLSGNIYEDGGKVVGLLANAAASAQTALVVKASSGNVLEVGAVGAKGVLSVGKTLAEFTIAASNTFTLGAASTWSANDPIRILSVDVVDRPDDPGISTLEFYPSTASSDAVCSFIPALSLQTYDDSGVLSGADYSNQTLNLELLLNCSAATTVTQCQSYVLAAGVYTLQADGQLFSSI